MDRAAGAETVGAAAQDHRVAGFQAQHAGVGRDIGAAFEDHGDDAERHPHALDGHAVRPLPAFGDDADGIGDIAHGRDAVGHRIDARLRQRQPIDEGRGRAAGAHFRDILGIGREDRGRIGADGALDRFQRVIFLFGRGKRQHPRGGARAAASSVIRAGKSALPSIAFSGALMSVPASQLRPCPSTEIPVLRGAEAAWLAGGARSREAAAAGSWRLGHWP